MGDYSDEHSDWYDYDDEPQELDFVLDYISINRETKQAWLVQFEMTESLEYVEAWLPKSQCALLPKMQIQVPAWLVYEKDLEQYDVRK